MQNMISNKSTIDHNLVESLPAGHSYGGARAVPTPKGPIVLVSDPAVLYLLVCNGNICTWQKQSQQLKDGGYGVMMVLPDGYSC